VVTSRRLTILWAAGALAGTAYGAFLIATALGLPSGADLTGQFFLQPAAKVLMAALLAGAAMFHPVRRERRWLVAALLFSAAGDFLLAMPWWKPSFVLGLAAFLLAHLCYLAALMPLARRSGPRLAAAAVTVLACVALLARLPTPWTALGAVCFAVSDAMIGISEFVLDDQLLAVPIWWAYATSQVLITAGFFFGRTSVRSVTPAG
jgi:uncharacterized membrane protein YhhN